MRKAPALLLCCLLITFFSCTKPSGVEVTEYFPAPSSYYSLYISDGMEVTVTNKVDEIVITADENVMEKVNVSCKNGRLRITRSDFSVYHLMTAKVLIPYNSYLHELDVESNSSFTSSYGLEGEDIKITANYYSDIDINYILADNLEMHLEFNSDFEGDLDVMRRMDLTMEDSDAKISGSADILYLKMSDGSEIKEQWYNGGYSFECNECNGTMTKNCKAYLHCYDNIAMLLTNNSFLYCTGEPDLEGSDWDNTSGIIFK
jgi:hypothetical protein